MTGQPVTSKTKFALYVVLALVWIQLAAAPARAQTTALAGGKPAAAEPSAKIQSPDNRLPSVESEESQGPGQAQADVQAAPAQVRSMKLVAPQVGWALVQQHLYWTNDDGGSWTDITPPGDFTQRIDGVFFLDSSHGWAVLAEKTSAEDGGFSLSFASTSDGGQSWRATPISTTTFPALRNHAGSSSIFFLDAQRGWLMLRLASSSNISLGMLLATEDGGETWTELPFPPAANPVYFVTPQDGWIAGGPAGDKLWTTNDAGRSWHENSAPLPEHCANCRVNYDLPTFRDLNEGVLPAIILGPDRALVATYLTHDGGQSWQVSEVREQSEASAGGVADAVVDSQVIWAMSGAGARVTIQGRGRTADSALPAGLWPHGIIVSADFADAPHGWALYSARRCAEFKTNCSQQKELLSTDDGGETFRIITPNRPLTASGEGYPDLLDDTIGNLGAANLLGATESLVGHETSPSAQTANITGTQVSQGLGFDRACVPTYDQMKAWWNDPTMPYSDVAVYIGGSQATCPPSSTLPSWVSQISPMGWGIIPIWAGPQATCVYNPSRFDQFIEASTASSQGQSEAIAAGQAANNLNIYNGIIYYDMELYYGANHPSCAAAVSAFIDAWVTELHTLGFLAGAYGSPYNAASGSSAVPDWTSQSIKNPPDVLWFYDTNGVASVLDPAVIKNSLWPNHQRIHQFCLDPDCSPSPGETFGNLPLIKVNGDVLDAHVVPGQHLPAPTLESPSNGATGVSTIPTFTWTEVSGATSYRIMVATAASALPFGADALVCAGCLINQTLTDATYTPAEGILQPGVTYYWQVNGRGQLFGLWSTPFSFTAGTSTATVTTLAASAIDVATVTLNGSTDPNGQATTVWFQYGTDSQLSAPTATAGQAVGSGESSQAFSINVAGLSPSTKYYYRAVAANGEGGTAAGLILNFTTLAAVAPAVSTNAVTSVTSGQAMFNGQLNPNGALSTGWFEYGTSGTLSTYTSTPPQSIGSDNLSHAFSWSVNGLNPGTKYYCRAAGSNAGGTTKGTILTFTTASGASGAITGTPTSLTSSSAVLNGTVNPAGSAGYAYFVWGTNSTLASSSIAGSTAVTPNSTTQPFSATITSLASKSTYYYRMVFENTSNGSYQLGSILSFTTLASTATTLPVSANTSSTAILNGTVNPAGSAGYAYFLWGANSTLATFSTAGSTAVSPNSTTQSFSFGITSLASNSTYYYRMVFENTSNGSYQLGSILSFTTLASTTTTLAASNITGSSAVLNGSVNPEGAKGQYQFQWSTDPALSTNLGTSCNSLGYNCPTWTANSTTQTFTQAVSGLPNSTTYFFRLVGYDSNNGGLWYGAILSFKTGSPPVVATTAASGITGSAAVLNGTVNPEGAKGQYQFQWSTDPALTTNLGTSCNSLGYNCPTWTANSTTQTFTQAVSGLPNSTTYFFRLVGYDSNNGGLWYGAILSFKTGSPPVVATTAASGITGSAAVLNGTVNPEGANGQYQFQWSTDSALSTSLGTSCNSLGYNCPTWTANSTTQTFTQAVSGLPNSTTYFFRLVGYDSNNGGLWYGAILSFKTGSPPVVATTAASGITGSAAVLNGTVNPKGANGQYQFQWSTDSALSTNLGTSCNSLGYNCPTWTANSTTQAFTNPVSGLPSSTTYYFRLVVYDSDNGGLWYGAILSFKTGSPPVVATTAASGITGSAAVLNGTVNPKGAKGQYQFQWSTDPALSTNLGTSCNSLGYNCPTWTANSTTQAFTNPVSGLPSSTTYYFRLVVYDSDNGSLWYGAILSFKTGSPPVVATTAASGITGSAAVLNGTVNPEGAKGQYQFQWSTDPTLSTNLGTSCNSLGYNCPMWTANSTTQAFTNPVSGLPSSTTYYFRLVVYDSDNGSLWYGAILSFKTGSPPVVATTAASGITGSAAVLNGTVNPEGAKGQYQFQWSTDPTLSTNLGTSCNSLGYNCPMWTANSTTQAFTNPVSGLPSSTTYYFRLVVYDSDNGSLWYGAILSFKTGSPPVVATTAASGITGSAAVLNGTVNPEGAKGQYQFQWSTDPTLSTNLGTSCNSLGYNCPMWTANSTTQAFNSALSGLPSSTIYYYRLVGYDSDNGSQWYGAVLSFKTP